MLHIRCGNDIIPKLQVLYPNDSIITYTDVLCQGPAPKTTDFETWIDIRARFMVTQFNLPVESMRRHLLKEDTDLQQSMVHDKIILWFEHDLYDQAILIYLLNWFQTHAVPVQRLFLMSLDSFPDVPHFMGFGQLSVEQLATLVGAEKQLTEKHLQEGVAAWRAYSAETPLALLDFMSGSNGYLPYLTKALLRFCNEYPSPENGINLTQQMILEIVSEQERTPAEIFKQILKLDEHPWLGDAMLWPYIKELASSEKPLLAFNETNEQQIPIDETTHDLLRLTQLGELVRDNRADWIPINGIDRWQGGVHLSGTRECWRWDSRGMNFIKN